MIRGRGGGVHEALRVSNMVHLHIRKVGVDFGRMGSNCLLIF